MRLPKIALFASTVLLTSAAFAGPRLHRSPTSPKLFKQRAPAPKPHASIDGDRATQIQTALIHSGYLTGQPTGTWDAQSEAAMQKLQADNGWQTKLVPDARALNKLGLGANSQPEGDLANTTSGSSTPEPAAAPEAGTPANR